MTNPWAPFLQQYAAPYNGNNGSQSTHHTELNEPEFDSANTLIPLSDYRIITISGPDALTFVQGQCTCDFTQLANDQWLRGAHCNPKGRMISSFTAAQVAPNVIGLRVHYSIATIAADALKKYLVFSKATCEISELMAVGFSSAMATTLNLSLTPQHTSHTPFGLMLASCHFAELWLTKDQLQALINTVKTALAVHGQALTHRPESTVPIFNTPAAWQQIMIENAIAEVTLRTSEQFLPQAFNYDAIGAVSFKKGCYTGQEIIARLHYKGQSKQRLHLAQSPHPAVIGQAIVNKDNKVIGEVINTCGSQILACSSGFLGDSEMYLASHSTEDHPIEPSKNQLTHKDLPYSLT